MNGGEISGNSASSSYSGGGGVYNSSGTFTMNGGEISGNSASSSSSGGGGVYNERGTFTMNDGEISGNSASSSSYYYSYSYSYGGGVYISNNSTFTMSGGEISGNSASSSYSSYSYSYGGGVYISSGTFTMNDGEISGNSASSSSSYYSYSYGGGVYISNNSTFTMSGGATVLNNTVFLDNNSAITIDTLTGTGDAALVEVSGSLPLGKTILQRAPGFTGPLPVERFAFAGPWELNAEGKLQARAADLGFGETRSGWLGGSTDFHLYRFTPNFNKTYSFTLTRKSAAYSVGSSTAVTVIATAAWANAGANLVNSSVDYHQTTFTTPKFVATDTRDITIMVSGSDSYPGGYTIRYNEE
jgi:hypothetical protein